jgi:DNA-binding CsgD family transcriptional regulator
LKNRLTEREKGILKLVLDEKSSLEIASILNLSIRTIDTHRKNILRKTSSKSLISLLKFAIKAGLIEDFYFKRKVNGKTLPKPTETIYPLPRIAGER